MRKLALNSVIKSQKKTEAWGERTEDNIKVLAEHLAWSSGVNVANTENGLSLVGSKTPSILPHKAWIED